MTGRPNGFFSPLMLGLVVSFAWACGSSPTGPATEPGAGTPGVMFQVSGIVTNDDGAPIADAIVTLTHQPDLAAPQSVSTTTGADGRYQLRLLAQQPGNVNALIRA